MLKLITKIKNFFNPLYQVVYTTKDGRTEMYTINKPNHDHEFGNVFEGARVVGFRSFCHNRKGIRSFRYDQIVTINKGV
tara:strand:+ start:4782 stop:5018 length:237 start_codon:yes stop_codon:yes gene_type:complete